jgi:hypothetical protein
MQVKQRLRKNSSFWWCHSRAGAVKNNKIKKKVPRVTSWKLNVREEFPTSVLAFNYKEKINILDRGTRILPKIPLEL